VVIETIGYKFLFTSLLISFVLDRSFGYWIS